MSRVPHAYGNYYVNDLALQNRMKNVMDQLMSQYPYTHEGTFGGFVKPAYMQRGGDNRGYERPSGNRELLQSRMDGVNYGSKVGGLVEGDEKYMHPNLPRRKKGGRKKKGMPGSDPASYSPFPLGGKVSKRMMSQLAHDVVSRGLGVSGGYTEKGPMHKPGLLGATRGGRKKKSSSKKRAKKGSWIAHVKAYAKKHKIPYGQAMKEAKSSYHGK